MSSVAKRQELPPPGGYNPINFKRIPARTFFNGYTLFGGYLAMTAGAAYIYYLNCVMVHRDEIEMRSAVNAVFPMILAERDREYLKQLRRNRDEEAKLMANVEGWVVGTYYGEPLYKNVSKSTLLEPSHLSGYYVHASTKEFNKRGLLSLWM